jgi:hypothetical protein
MTIKLLKYFSLLLLLTQFSCVQKYWPDLGGAYEDALVVDGIITNKAGPYTVKLSRSASVGHPKWKAYTGCTVSIICDDGSTEILTEKKPGIYQTSPQGIQGEIGKKYKINIKTPDEKTYESAFEELKVPVELASVYHEEETQPAEELNHSLEGLRFFVDTKPAVNDTNYLLWRMESTYKFQSSYLIRYTYDERRLQPFPKPDTFYYCWKTQEIPELFTYETTQLSEPVLKHFPLHYVSTQSRELSIRYSLLVHQLTITAEAYSYWNSLREQNENQDNLYNKQPYQILGNIKNINNPDEAVMGYFLVAGLSEKRIFVNRPIIPFYYWECVLSAPDYERMRDLRWSAPSEWPIYITADDDFRLAYPDQDCLDCREKDGEIEEPDFWED